MKSNDFYEDLRYCPSCCRYVRYLRAWEKSYCVHCRKVVKIFSDVDLAELRREARRSEPSVPA